MLSRNTAYPQYQPPLAKMHPLVPGQLLPISLLKICEADARSLAEIKRKRIGYTLSIYFGVATTQMPAYFQKGLDTHVVGSIILTAHSSQLTAHSSQRELYLDNFLSTFHRHYYLFSLYTQKQTAKYVIYFKDSAIHLVPTQLLIMNYEFIISYKFHSALYCNSRQAVWFDTG